MMGFTNQSLGSTGAAVKRGKRSGHMGRKGGRRPFTIAKSHGQPVQNTVRKVTL